MKRLSTIGGNHFLGGFDAVGYATYFLSTPVYGCRIRPSTFDSDVRSSTEQALGMALESARLDVVTRISELTKDTRLSYLINTVLDSGFKLAYCTEVLDHAIPLSTVPSVKRPRMHVPTRFLASPPLSTPFLFSFIADISEDGFLAYKTASSRVESGTRLHRGNAVVRAGSSALEACRD